MPLSAFSSASSSGNEKFKIVLFGDSIIAGYGLPEEDTLPFKLEKFLTAQGKEVSVINAGVSGDTSSGGVARLKWTLETYKPDLLFIGIGGNDMLRGVSPSIVKTNIENMLETANQFGVRVILNEVKSSPNLGKIYQKQFDDIFLDIKKTHNVETYPFLLTHIFGKKDLMQSDLIHPSAEGVNVVITGFGPYMAKFVD